MVINFMLTSSLNCFPKISANLISRMPLNVFFCHEKDYVSIRFDLHYTFISIFLQDLTLRWHHIEDLHHQIDFDSINLRIIRIEMSLMCENVIFFVFQHKKIVIFSNFLLSFFLQNKTSVALSSPRAYFCLYGIFVLRSHFSRPTRRYECESFFIFGSFFIIIFEVALIQEHESE